MASEPQTVRIDFNVNDTPQSIRAFLRRLAAVWQGQAPACPLVLDYSKCQYVGAGLAVTRRSTRRDPRTIRAYFG